MAETRLLLLLFGNEATVTGSRHRNICIFISPATGKLEEQDRFQLRGNTETQPLKVCSDANISNSKTAPCYVR